MKGNDIFIEKQELRERIWKEMEAKGIAKFPLPCFGRIPNFKGAEVAALKLRFIDEYGSASYMMVNPDSPQRPVRRMALLDGKVLVMPTPRLKSGYLVIRPEGVKGKEREASTIRGAFKYGESTDAPSHLDLIVEGSVAVDLDGNRLGKGKGFGDREISLAEDIRRGITVATTVHDIQIVDSVPREEHDRKVDLIVTPTKIIRVRPKIL
ncbi:MAG: 5-formyltetrahydrofolate cyclo-ligase [archaeon]|nr:5-formyltetrahydrofolate cyclo-ligase [archaeon]MCP8305923.1 5-formyltetrahydrofolate cyclo-ligase [archaeon]